VNVFLSQFFVPGLLVALGEVFHALFYFFLFLWGIQTISGIVCKLIEFWFASRTQFLLQAQDALLREDVLGDPSELGGTIRMPVVKKVGK
jgi:hypothetical protein